VYGWFTEWFDTRDLKEAKALLDTAFATGRPGQQEWLWRLPLKYSRH
jgi:predicted ATPase